MEKLMQNLSNRCVDTHAIDDIWEHLEEECLELLLAIKRVKRKREPFINVIEEITDVRVELNTIITLIHKRDIFSNMLENKLDIFKRALDSENIEKVSTSKINRYEPMSKIMIDNL
jgi:phosphoribosyl-ATP pyrophosphohydrolase